MKKNIQGLIKYVSDNYEELLKLSIGQLSKNFIEKGFEIKECYGREDWEDHSSDGSNWSEGLVINGVEIFSNGGCSCYDPTEDMYTTKEVLNSILGEIQPHTCKVNEKDLPIWNYD